MKRFSLKFATLPGALVAALLFTPVTRAECGIDLTRLPHTPLQSRAAVVAPQERLNFPGQEVLENDQAIVGFWHVKFTVGSGSSAAEIDAGYSQWHSDGTEIMNSGGRAPVTTNFCLGVWKPVGWHMYKLNHFAASWDPTQVSTANPNGVLLGPAQIQEQVTLSHDGTTFTGTFTIDQYDESLNPIAHVEGTITGTRIDVDTPASSIF